MIKKIRDGYDDLITLSLQILVKICNSKYFNCCESMSQIRPKIKHFVSKY